MYTVCFKSWYNNWSDPIEFEEYATLNEAKSRADEMYSLEVVEVAPNQFVCNGTETWVEDAQGRRVL